MVEYVFELYLVSTRPRHFEENMAIAFTSVIRYLLLISLTAMNKVSARAAAPLSNYFPSICLAIRAFMQSLLTGFAKEACPIDT